MADYLSNTANQQEVMLKELGFKSLEDLYSNLPQDLILQRPLNLELGQSEFKVLDTLKELASKNKVYKTIYSPSPTSYVEPRTAAFTGFTTNGGYTTSISDFNVNSSFNNGWNFYCQTNHQGGTIFFSALAS